VVTINDRIATAVDHRDLGGVRSSGEFGSILHEMFDPETQTRFEWQRLEKWHGHVTNVFSCTVLQSLSHYDIHDDATGRHAVVGYHGLIHADVKTNMVTHIIMDCDISVDFPIRQVNLLIDYDSQQLSNQDFLLPSKFVLTSRTGKQLSKDTTEFRLYHKYSADETIIFDAVEPAPPVKKQP